MNQRVWLSFDRCPVHDFTAFSIEADNGSNDSRFIGLRLTSSKCCGQWETVKRKIISLSTLKDVIADVERRAIKQEEKGK